MYDREVECEECGCAFEAAPEQKYVEVEELMNGPLVTFRVWVAYCPFCGEERQVTFPGCHSFRFAY